MWLILSLQFLLPLALLVLLALCTPRNWLGFVLLLLAIASLLAASALVGLWTFLPWWTAQVLACLLLLLAVVKLRKWRAFNSLYPVSAGAWCAAGLFLALGILALAQGKRALEGRTVPPGSVVDLAFPLSGGSYLVVNGGSQRLINAHMATLDATVPRFRPYRGQSYGIDIVKIDGFGLRAPGFQPSDPTVYTIYGAAVLAPCSGEVVAAVDGLADMPVPETDRAHMAGNHVILRCAGVDVLLGHLRPGSIGVSVGNRVETGAVLGEVGNSGNSEEPHLHVHAQMPGTDEAPMAAEPLPLRFAGRYLVRNQRIRVD